MIVFLYYIFAFVAIACLVRVAYNTGVAAGRIEEADLRFKEEEEKKGVKDLRQCNDPYGA